ncbi:MAG: hypothetical protein BGN86_06930 [Caulobacterales bacterium 68-7]|nr:MAG: hypothetical protein BGN86_06930 [Caulobacterales bacterium 68-7]
MICTSAATLSTCVLLSSVVVLQGAEARAEDRNDRLILGGSYKGDLIAYDGGEGRRGAAALDLLTVIGDAHLGREAGGLNVHLHVENTSGDEPNTTLGLSRGFDNSEVTRPRLRLYEAWVEKATEDGSASLLLGFYDLNSEFNVTDSSALFLGPAFGISTEYSGSSAAGPSIFPSAGLAVRAQWRPTETSYLRAAVLNAHVGVQGDPGGAQFRFDQGVLIASEAGFTQDGRRLALGAWRYSDVLEESRSPDHHTQGAYLMVEQRIGGEDAPTTAFLRAGISDGRTGDFRAGLQAGVLVAPAWPGRPDSAFGFGIDSVAYSKGYREDRRLEGLEASAAETGLEVTYSDRLIGQVFLQPDLQLSVHPEGDPQRDVAMTATLRVTVEF